MDAKIDLIYDMVKDLNGKQDTQTERLIRLESNVDRNTEDLADHIEGVKGNRKLIKLTEQKLALRLDELEEPKKTAKSVGKFLKWAFGIISVVAGGLYGVYRLYNLK